jgi:hypothetical protein
VKEHVPQPPASLSVQPASSEERALLENLTQFYYYDFSEVLEMHVDEDGRFANVDLSPYWVDEWRHPFLLRVDKRVAGFALISARSKITGKSGVFDMTEFFVLRRFRRHGMGAPLPSRPSTTLRGHGRSGSERRTPMQRRSGAGRSTSTRTATTKRPAGVGPSGLRLSKPSRQPLVPLATLIATSRRGEASRYFVRDI